MSDNELKHNNTLSIFNIMFENSIVASYVGPFDGDILTILAENLEQTLWHNETQRRRFFKIFIELSQNIAYYSEEKSIVKGKEYGEGTLLINDYKDYFLLSAGNLVSAKTKEFLMERCEEINSLDRFGLRSLKRKFRMLGNNKGGGNIGMVQVALLSKHPLDIIFIPTSDENFTFYLVSVRIDKDYS